MIERPGDLWAWQAERRWIVIPTNIGWKKDGANPMGAGVALQASEMYPELANWYGARCKKFGENAAVCFYPDGNLKNVWRRFPNFCGKTTLILN